MRPDQVSYRQNLFLAGLLSLFFLFTVAINWPGHYSVDSIIQLTEGMTGYYFSIAPALMSVMLGWITRLFGHGAFIVVVTGMFYTALWFFISRRRMMRSWGGLLMLAFLCINPIILIYNGIVWKDVVFANIALIGFALADQAQPRKNISVAVVLALIAAACAALIRQQGLIASVFICLLIAARVRANAPSKARLAIRTILLLVVTFVLSAMISFAVSLAQREKTVIGFSAGLGILIRYDIAGMVARNPVNTRPVLVQYIKEADLAITSAKQEYSPDRVDTLNQFDRVLSTLDFNRTLFLWRDLVLAKPSYFFAHKWASWKALLGPRPELQCLPVHVGVSAETISLLQNAGVPYQYSQGFVPQPSRYADSLYKYSEKGSWLFTGWIWLLICFALIFASYFKKNMIVGCIASAGALYTLSFLLVGIACDFRYQYFTVVAGMVGTLIFYIDTANARRS